MGFAPLPALLKVVMPITLLVYLLPNSGGWYFFFELRIFFNGKILTSSSIPFPFASCFSFSSKFFPGIEVLVKGFKGEEEGQITTFQNF